MNVTPTIFKDVQWSLEPGSSQIIADETTLGAWTMLVPTSTMLSAMVFEQRHRRQGAQRHALGDLIGAQLMLASRGYSAELGLLDWMQGEGGLFTVAPDKHDLGQRVARLTLANGASVAAKQRGLVAWVRVDVGPRAEGGAIEVKMTLMAKPREPGAPAMRLW